MTLRFHLTCSSYKLHMLVLMGPLQGNDLCCVAKMIKLYSKTLKATSSHLSPHLCIKKCCNVISNNCKGIDQLLKKHAFPLFCQFGNCRSVKEFEKLNRIGEGTYGIVCKLTLIC